MNFRPKLSREMQERINGVDKHNAFHSHAYARIDPLGKRIGSSSAPVAFSDRLQQDRSRQHVGQYRQSKIGVPVEHAKHQMMEHKSQNSDASEPVAGNGMSWKNRMDIKPNVSGRPNPGFQEPRGRGYNPYA